MLNIVLIVKYYYPLKRPSGILRFVMNLSEKLGRISNLTIITCKFDKKHESSERFKGYGIIRVNSPFYISSAIEAAKLKPDLVIFGTGIPKPWLLFFVLLIFKKTKAIFSYLYGGPIGRIFLYQFVELEYKYRFFAGQIGKIVNKVICTNRYIYSYYSKNGKSGNAIYLPPGIDLAKFYNIKNRTNEKIRVGFFGHLSYNKGSDMLLNSFLKLNNGNIELLLAGLGNLEDELKKRSLKHENIFIRGYIDNIEDAIASCDLLVFPYRHSEMILGLSLSAIEGLAMGKPLLVSDSNCLRDLVIHGKNGYVFNNEDELTGHLSELTEDRNKLRAFGLRSKEKSSEFDIDLICDKLIDAIAGGNQP
ncbi:MAG: glycosyltransferase family 4 protein [Minisyncoccia bacterium]